MKFSICLLQMLVSDVSVHLRRADIAMTEEHLDRAQVGAVAQQGGGEAMAQDVRRDVFEPGPRAIILDQLPEALPRHPARALLDE